MFLAPKQLALAPRRGQRVLDLCAAPGGKSEREPFAFPAGGPSSSRSHSPEPRSLPARFKRFARTEASDRPELAYLDAWASREVDEQGQELAPPTPPPRRSLSLGAAVALKELQLPTAAAAAAPLGMPLLEPSRSVLP